MNNKILFLLKEFDKILNNDNLRFEIAYSRDACCLEDEQEYIDNLHDEVKSAIAELERSRQ